jgi:hypothetical protein
LPEILAVGLEIFLSAFRNKEFLQGKGNLGADAISLNQLNGFFVAVDSARAIVYCQDVC